jgi:hypothetical protein
MIRFEFIGFEFKRNQALQTPMIEKQIDKKITVANLQFVFFFNE